MISDEQNCPRYSANKLLSELGITTPEEIDIEAIAEFCCATVVYEYLHGSSARILGLGDRAIITVDRQSGVQRQRFSAAHELGHWIIDRGKLASFVCSEKDFIGEWNRDNPERRANRYAADLLMPKYLFEPIAKNQEITLKTVRSLCERFQTSLTATAIRLVECGSFPAILVCSDKSGRRWFVRGKDVPEALQLVDKPTRHTYASDLLSGHSRESGANEVQADSWISHQRSGYYSLIEDSIGTPGGLVLSLLWWKDESQLLDLSEDYW